MTATATRDTASAAADKLFSDGADARREVIALAVKIVEGQKVSDAELTAARQRAEMDRDTFASLLSILQERKMAVEAHNALGLGKMIEASLEERRKIATELPGLAKAMEDARDAYVAANQRVNHLSTHSSVLAQKQQQEFSKLLKVMTATGDGHDWRKIR